MVMKFAVCGEALFDVFSTGVTPTGLSLDARIGGSPLNVAVGLSRLGQSAALVTVLSAGFLGDRLRHYLAQEGVDLRLTRLDSAPTTLSLVGVDAHGVPSYAFYGEAGADRLLDESILQAWPGDVDCIHVGSYTTVVGRTAHTQRQLIDRERHRSLIAYDPNVRLNVEPDGTIWRAQLEWMLSRAHLLKISEEDLHLLYPQESPADFAHRALTGGVSLVVVTRGADGAVAWTPQLGALESPPVPVQVVDTVGAGDTFQAALLTWLAERGRLEPEALAQLAADELAQALGFAGQAAALTCSRRGADLPRRVEMGI